MANIHNNSLKFVYLCVLLHKPIIVTAMLWNKLHFANQMRDLGAKRRFNFQQKGIGDYYIKHKEDENKASEEVNE